MNCTLDLQNYDTYTYKSPKNDGNIIAVQFLHIDASVLSYSKVAGIPIQLHITKEHRGIEILTKIIYKYMKIFFPATTIKNQCVKNCRNFTIKENIHYKTDFNKFLNVRMSFVKKNQSYFSKKFLKDGLNHLKMQWFKE